MAEAHASDGASALILCYPDRGVAVKGDMLLGVAFGLILAMMVGLTLVLVIGLGGYLWERYPWATGVFLTGGGDSRPSSF